MDSFRSRPSLYDQLKVTPDAPSDVIRAAYRALAAKHHPDRQRNAAASHERMAAVNAAYETLMDPSRRARYDEQLSAGERTPKARLSAEAQARASLLRAAHTQRDDAWSERAQRSRFVGNAQDDFSETRVDMEWMEAPLARRSRRRPFLIGCAAVAVLATGMLGVWVSQMQIARADAELALSASLRRSAVAARPFEGHMQQADPAQANRSALDTHTPAQADGAARTPSTVSFRLSGTAGSNDQATASSKRTAPSPRPSNTTATGPTLLPLASEAGVHSGPGWQDHALNNASTTRAPAYTTLINAPPLPPGQAAAAQ